MARAVYARKQIALFDDVFSGLDKVTERVVFAKVFSRDGLLRKNGTTVVLATHAGKSHWKPRRNDAELICTTVHHLTECDYVIALGQDGRVTEQGTFEHLRSNGNYIKKLDVAEPYSSDEEDQDTIDKTEGLDTPVEASYPEKSAPDSEKKELLKMASDRSTFRYYFNCLGRFPLLLLVISSAGFAFLINFRRKYILTSPTHKE